MKKQTLAYSQSITVLAVLMFPRAQDFKAYQEGLSAFLDIYQIRKQQVLLNSIPLTNVNLAEEKEKAH